MTDAPARQEQPDNESGGPSSNSSRSAEGGARSTQVRQGSRTQLQTEAEQAAQDQGQQQGQRDQDGKNLPVPQWSAQQPAPAPWFLGQAGPVPPNFPPPMPFPPQQPQGQYPPAPMPPGQTQPGQTQPGQAQPGQTQPGQTQPGPMPYPIPPQYPGAPLPPPSPDQANWPNQAPGTRPEQSPGQSDQSGQPAASGHRGGQEQPAGPQPQPGAVPAAGPPRAPGQSPGPALGPNGSPQQPAPWLDPNRYNQPGQRPPQYDPHSPYRQPQPPRQPQQPPGTEPGKRPPLGLRTRWARGLALGGAACTLITLLNGYRNFPDWLIAAVAGLLMSLGGLWFGTFAQRDALRKSQRAPEAVASVVWSSISALIALAIVSYSLIFFPQLRQYSDCMRAANTIAAQSACQQQFENSLVALP